MQSNKYFLKPETNKKKNRKREVEGEPWMEGKGQKYLLLCSHLESNQCREEWVL